MSYDASLNDDVDYYQFLLNLFALRGEEGSHENSVEDIFTCSMVAEVKILYL